MLQKEFELDITTQGPAYPPSEILDENGNFLVIGNINLPDSKKGVVKEWSGAIVSKKSKLPSFGENLPYEILEFFDIENIPNHIKSKVLYTLPLPLPCNNYPMVFAPEQKPCFSIPHPSYPFHAVPIPDLKSEHGRKLKSPVTLGDWVKGKGKLGITLINEERDAYFEFEFSNLIPNSLYTVMSLREHDLNPAGPTRPGPLGVPNVFFTDKNGNAYYDAVMPSPFPSLNIEETKRNRIINIVVLWMSTQMSYGGAIGHYGLGGDIHAQLKLKKLSFFEFQTQSI
jgi:hypothetical protein